MYNPPRCILRGGSWNCNDYHSWSFLRSLDYLITRQNSDGLRLVYRRKYV